MRAPVLVTTPYPTMVELAKDVGVSLKRAREIEKMVDEIHDRNVLLRRKARERRRKKTLNASRVAR